LKCTEEEKDAIFQELNLCKHNVKEINLLCVVKDEEIVSQQKQIATLSAALSEHATVLEIERRKGTEKCDELLGNLNIMKAKHCDEMHALQVH
jgi:hypothetical protein